MTKYNQTLKTNNSSLEEIITQLNNMPDAGAGTELPTLTNEGSASDLLSGKQLIDAEGNVVTGTIPTNTSSDLTASGATVTVPVGYYASNATKTIASGSAKTPATTVTKNPSISVSSSGLITASVSGTQSVTPTVTAGYVSSGTSGTITVNGSATKQLTTQAAKTITPSTSSQTAVAGGRYTTGAVTVAPIPSNYEDVATETTEYTSLNDELEDVINSLPAAGGGSGGSEPVTCTVTINSFDANIRGLQYSTYTNGIYEWHDETIVPNVSSIVLNDVVCGGYVWQLNDYDFCWQEVNNSNYTYFENNSDFFELVPTGDITVTIIDDE